MLKKIKGKVDHYYRAFQGLYHDKKEGFLDLPEGIEQIVLGETVEGREVSAFHFGRNGKVKILFLAGIHGNEVGTVKLMHRLVDFLRGNFRFLGVEIFVIPCLNLDGLARAIEQPAYFKAGEIGRFNSNGVDLNRNFDTPSFRSENYWYFGDKNVRVNCGEKVFCEPESRMLADFVKEKSVNVLYSFHNRGREVYGSADRLAQDLVKDFVKWSGYRYVGEEEEVGKGQTGTLKEWCEVSGVSYVEVECRSRWASDWEHLKPAIIKGIKYHYG